MDNPGVWIGGVLVVLGLGMLLVLGVMGVAGTVWLMRRSGGSGPPSREDTMRNAGFAPHGNGQWAMEISGSKLVFTESPENGWLWSVQLPRYNTLTLRVEERVGPSSSEPQTGTFETRNPQLDERFLVSSELPAQTLALVMSPKVGHAMLSMHHLSLVLKGDELRVRDPRHLNLKARAGEGALPGDPSTAAAETEVHQDVAALVMAILGTLYSKLTGTLLPEHR